MERLTKTGTVHPKKSVDIKKSRIGLGFEKLDRDVFDPEKCYEFVANSGVKWARLQSGWQRTEREKGVYHFEWLDSIVDNMLRIGVKPWLCLCYGNDLYTEPAKKVFGAVGCPPIFSEEEKEAWVRYVKATVEHFKGRIEDYEVWNEPDGKWCWKHGPNGTELGEFTIATAKACKETDPECRVIGMSAYSFQQDYLDAVAATGAFDYMDAITYHGYEIHEEQYIARYYEYKDFLKKLGRDIPIIQGESGTQSRSDGAGALRGGAWTPLKQAKFLLRHLLSDINCGVEFASYFSCMDMIEALNGTVGDLASYLDYGYFGVIGADFDETGKATGEYTPKMSYKALQTLSSLLCEEYEVVTPDIQDEAQESIRLQGNDNPLKDVLTVGFRKANGSAIAYWIPKNILTETIETTISIRVHEEGEIRLIDLLTGDIYSMPETMIQKAENGVVLVNLPVTDSPLMLTFGGFYE